jgi:hypothetical protein
LRNLVWADDPLHAMSRLFHDQTPVQEPLDPQRMSTM